MSREWLLVEVTGERPFVVAQGHTLKKFVPLPDYLRRNACVRDILALVEESTRTGRPLQEHAIDGKTAVCTEVVIMNDDRVHGVHVWTGPASSKLPERPLPGAVTWNLTTATASDTPQALLNSGLDLNVESTDSRPFAADLPIGKINQGESKVLAQSMVCKPGDTFSGTWDVSAYDGKSIRVSFAVRASLERQADGAEHLICRAMNWRVPHHPTTLHDSDLANQILTATAQQGIHRAIVDLRNWNLLKWIDPPCDYIDWRVDIPGKPLVHPDDHRVLSSMSDQFTRGPASGLLRLRAGDSWTLMHATAHRIKLLENVYAGLISIRLPTPAELLHKSKNRQGSVPTPPKLPLIHLSTDEYLR